MARKSRTDSVAVTVPIYRNPVFEQMGQQWAEQMFQARHHIKGAGEFYYDAAKITLRQMGVQEGKDLDAAANEVCEAALDHWRKLCPTPQTTRSKTT